ncbi:MAG: alpha/beta hydrolase [Bacteroidales bacterium]|jgi:acetyl esterase/lipase|nr:alpha/beta hydrolase [Bacteroidales bacterium]
MERIFKTINLLIILLFFCHAASAQQEIFLYGTKDTSGPSITVWLPEGTSEVKKAVIVCPGGGYGTLVIDREGHTIAKEFNKLGIAAFVLKYRLPDRTKNTDQSLYPLQDVQTAIKMVRQRAKEWKIDPGKIGIMGFSAGGHLASTAGTHYHEPAIEADGISLRPDFMILVYPVISFMDAFGHTGSRKNLIGESASREKVLMFSNDLHVDNTTPPTFLTHGTNDAVVKVANSLAFYQALIQNNVSAELHIYADGHHGYPQSPPFEEWFGRCTYWLKKL